VKVNAVDQDYRHVRKIAVFRAGLLGDTLVSLPALWCLKERFPNAQLIHIWQRVPNVKFVTAKEVLNGSAIVDEFIADELSDSKISRIWNIVKLWWGLRAKRIDLAIVLEAAFWSNKRKWFLKMCGIKHIIAWPKQMPRIKRDTLGRMVRTDHISDQLLNLLARNDILVDNQRSVRMELPLTIEEEKNVDAWLKKNDLKVVDNLLVAVAPWSNMSLKRWPLEKYEWVIQQLIVEFGIIPIVFGGKEEQAIGKKMVQMWGTGVVAAGELNVREGIGVIRNCRFFLGNDTGVMHMAVASGVPCVAIFSAMDNMGLWEPYGQGHRLHRERVECEGCLLRDCVEKKMECIKNIKREDVLESCRRYIV
jgi:ADP-heptose:LPS heptosyltransferase